MSVNEPDPKIVNNILIQVEKRHYSTALKTCRKLKKDNYKNSLILASLEARCLASLSIDDNKDKALKIFEKSLLLIKKSNKPVDIEVLDQFSVVLKIYQKFSEACEMFEENFKKFDKKNPANEEFLLKLFFSYVRCMRYKDQQKISQLLDKNFQKKKYSLYWTISMILQVKPSEYSRPNNPDEPKKKLPLFYQFGIKLLTKNLYKVRHCDVELLLYIIDFFKSLGMYNECIKILQEKVSCLMDNMSDRKYELAKLFYLIKDYNKSKLLYLYLIENDDTEQWRFWKGYLNSAIKCTNNDKTSIKMNIESAKKYSKEREDKDDDKFNGQSSKEHDDSEYVIESNNVNMSVHEYIKSIQKKYPKKRTAYLAEIEYLYMKDVEKGGEAEKIMMLCYEYYKRYGSKLICYYDVEKYMVHGMKNVAEYEGKKKLMEKYGKHMSEQVKVNEKLLVESEKVMKESVKNEKNENAKNKKKNFGIKLNTKKKALPKKFNVETQNHIKLIMSHLSLQINYYKFLHLLNLLHCNNNALEETKLLQKIYNIYNTSVHKFSKYITKETTNQFGDELIIIIVLRLLERYIHSNNDTKYIIESIIILENSLKKSKFNFGFKVLLIRLYCLIGSDIKAMNVYQSLDIKHIQNISLSYLLYYEYIFFTKWEKANVIIYKQIDKFYVNEYKNNIRGMILKAYRNQTWSRINEVYEFKQMIDQNEFVHDVEMHKVYMELPYPLGSDNKGVVSESYKKIKNKNVFLEYEKCEKLYYKEDYSIFEFKKTKELSSLLFPMHCNYSDSVRKSFLSCKKIALNIVFIKNTSSSNPTLIKKDLLCSMEKELQVLNENKHVFYNEMKLLYEVLKSEKYSEEIGKLIDSYVVEMSKLLRNEKNFVVLRKTFFLRFSFFLKYLLKLMLYKSKEGYKKNNILKILQKKLKTIKNLFKNVSKKKNIFLIKSEKKDGTTTNNTNSGGKKKGKKKKGKGGGGGGGGGVDMVVLKEKIDVSRWNENVHNMFKMFREIVNDISFDLK